jgi:hypothetical protein
VCGAGVIVDQKVFHFYSYVPHPLLSFALGRQFLKTKPKIRKQKQHGQFFESNIFPPKVSVNSPLKKKKIHTR